MRPTLRVSLCVSVCATVMAAGLAQAADQTPQEVFDAAKAYGKQLANDTAAKVRDGSAENDTVRRTVPGYTSNPPQAQAYRNQDLNGPAARQRAQCQQTPDDPTCAAIAVGTANRPAASDLSPSDPALAAQAVVANPTLVLGDIASTYNACAVGGAMTAPAQFARRACSLQTTGWSDFSCRKTLTVSPLARTNCASGAVIGSGAVNQAGLGSLSVQALCDAMNAPRVPFRIASSGPRGSCGQPLDVTVDLSKSRDIAAQGASTRIGALRERWDWSCEAVQVYLEGGCSNGQCNVSIVKSAGLMWVPDAPRSFRGRWAPQPNRYSRVDLSFPLASVVPAAGESWANGCRAYEQKTSSLAPDGQAPASATAVPVAADAGAAECVRMASVCSDGPSTKVIDGVPVTRECWSYANTYACTTLAASSTCGDAALRSCSAVGSASCQQTDGLGHCTQASAVFECRTADATFAPALNCGNASFCANGSCWDNTYHPNQGFGKAATQLEAHMQAGKDIDAATVQIFKGTDRRCHRDNFGIDNCCDDSAYLQRCSNDEQETVRRRNQGQCHEVGQYCSASSWLFGCREHTKTYCCFSSLLARVIQEQGRAQISRAWGTPENPSCIGFTPDELARLDWSRFDLSEFYAQIHVAQPPAQGSVTGGAQSQQSGCYYGQGRC